MTKHLAAALIALLMAPAGAAAVEPADAALQWWQATVDAGGVSHPDTVTVELARITPWAAGTHVRLR
ncbi:MAG: hypothetical protein GY898_03940 [Proteobacteria bacterium]|nr:hypothetical protein [Pseudomonadota bacterium]